MWLLPLLLGSWLVGVSVDTPPLTSGTCSLQSLDFALQAVAVLLLTIAGLVGRRAATTSQDVRRILEDLARQSDTGTATPSRFDRRKRSTKGTTST